MAEQDQSEDDEDSPTEDLDPKVALKRKLSQANKSGSKKEKQKQSPPAQPVDTYDAEEDY